MHELMLSFAQSTNFVKNNLVHQILTKISTFKKTQISRKIRLSMIFKNI
jgi:hypothetical protein